MASLTPRGKALRRMSSHRGITEDPYSSNKDERPNRKRYGDSRWGIRKAQEALGAWLVGLPWCGVWCAWALSAAGVKGVNYRQASVALIEDDARAGRGPFRDWRAPASWREVMRGDLVVWFGRGVHVEMVRGFRQIGGQVWVVTDGGNTSDGPGGSQSNGGGAFKRTRPLSQAHGFARVDYPGGKARAVVDRVLMAVDVHGVPREALSSAQAIGMPSSDMILMARLASHPEVGADAARLLDEIQAATY